MVFEAHLATYKHFLSLRSISDQVKSNKTYQPICYYVAAKRSLVKIAPSTMILNRTFTFALRVK